MQRRQRPYWLGGTEICAGCTQHHLLEQEYRCRGCDHSVCSHCAIHVGAGSVLCPGCFSDLGEE